MAKIKKPKLEDYLKFSNGQGLGSLVNGNTYVVINTNEERTIVTP